MDSADLDQMTRHAGEAEALLTMLANRHRLLVLCQLIDGDATVSQLLQVVPLNQSALSQHLAKLRQAGIVETTKEGRNIRYSITSQEVRRLIEVLCEIYKNPS